MALVLRKLDRRAAFYRGLGVDVGDVQADAISDLRTSKNALSVWQVNDDHTNIDRIVAALAAGRMNLDKLDYALIDAETLDELNIGIVQKRGRSLDDRANDLWHYDLTELTGTSLVNLAFMIQEKAMFVRVQKARIGSVIEASVRHGFIDSSRLKDGLRKALSLE